MENCQIYHCSVKFARGQEAAVRLPASWKPCVVPWGEKASRCSSLQFPEYAGSDFYEDPASPNVGGTKPGCFCFMQRSASEVCNYMHVQIELSGLWENYAVLCFPVTDRCFLTLLKLWILLWFNCCHETWEWSLWNSFMSGGSGRVKYTSSFSRVWLMTAIWKNGKMKQESLQSAVFWPESGNLEEEWSDYRSFPQKKKNKNKGIKSNLSQITVNDSIPQLFIPNERIR